MFDVCYRKGKVKWVRNFSGRICERGLARCLVITLGDDGPWVGSLINAAAKGSGQTKLLKFIDLATKAGDVLRSGIRRLE